MSFLSLSHMLLFISLALYSSCVCNSMLFIDQNPLMKVGSLSPLSPCLSLIFSSSFSDILPFSLSFSFYIVLSHTHSCLLFFLPPSFLPLPPFTFVSLFLLPIFAQKHIKENEQYPPCNCTSLFLSILI